MKDAALRSLARQYINSKISDQYGVVTKLEIDRAKKTIHAELDLKGESQPIIVDVTAYELISAPDKTLIRLADVKISRRWADALYQQFGRDKTFEVPDVVKALL
jgi:hypothetical protein